MADPTRVYWDSCVIVSHIEGVLPDRVAMAQAILHEVTDKRVRLFSSTFTVAEVAFIKAERDAGALDPDVEKAIDDLWRPGT